jgi:hypothetical protein
MNTSSTNQPTTGREQLEKEIEKKLQETMKEVGEKFGPLQEFYTKSANVLATFIEERERRFIEQVGDLKMQLEQMENKAGLLQQKSEQAEEYIRENEKRDPWDDLNSNLGQGHW